MRVVRRPRGSTVRIGLTGPIGCGKSTVAGWLAGRGAVVIDADAVAREVTDQPEVQAAIGAAFGPAVMAPGGGLDRRALADLVFGDATALRRLEELTHPTVRPRIDAAVAAAEADQAPAVVIEAIKLVEGSLADTCDEIWLVTCEPATQRARLADRGVPKRDAERRIAAQGAIRQRLAPRVTRVLTTDGPADAVEAAAIVVYAEALARPHPGREA